MAWTVDFIQSTDRDRVGSVIATWTEPTGEVFKYQDEQINTNTTAQKTNFVSRAKQKLGVWKTNLDKDKANIAAIKTELETLLNT